MEKMIFNDAEYDGILPFMQPVWMKLLKRQTERMQRVSIDTNPKMEIFLLTKNDCTFDMIRIRDIEWN